MLQFLITAGTIIYLYNKFGDKEEEDEPDKEQETNINEDNNSKSIINKESVSDNIYFVDESKEKQVNKSDKEGLNSEKNENIVTENIENLEDNNQVDEFDQILNDKEVVDNE